MANAEKKHLFFAQLILDFANAPSSDEACLTLFDNMQKSFGQLSAHFAEKAKKEFPSLLKCELSLEKAKMPLVKLLLEEKGSKKFLNDQFEISGNQIVCYNWEDQTLTFRNYRYGVLLYKGTIGVETEEMYTVEHVEELKEDMERELKPGTFHEVNKLMDVGKKISEFIKSKSISKPEFQKIKARSEIYADLIQIHNKIDNTRAELREFLAHISAGKRLSGSKIFRYFLETYNTTISPKLLLQKDNTIAFQTFFNIFSEDDFIKQFDTRNFFKISFSTHTYRLLLIYCLVEFLLHHNGKKLQRCLRCEKFFLAQRMDDKNKCCPECSHTGRLTSKQRTGVGCKKEKGDPLQ